LTGECENVSGLFVKFLDRKYGIQAKMVEIKMHYPEIVLETCDPAWKPFSGGESNCYHVAVLVHGYIVDFTWIQFDGKASIPVVYKKFKGRIKKYHEI